MSKMKILFLLPLISLMDISESPIKFSSVFQTDSTSIIHQLDGKVVEWPTEKFTTDKATKIRFAVDNDTQMLFLAISIPGKYEQQRVIQKGMSLFIDVKGKKKENRGVEFPLGMENGASIETMRIFGFDNSETFPQNIKTEGAINIALAWDSSFALDIEYSVPLKMLEESMTELNNKKISIGWKIKEGDASNTTQPGSTSSGLVAVPSSGNRPTSNRNVGLSQNITFPQSDLGKAQPIWTTHTIIFQ